MKSEIRIGKHSKCYFLVFCIDECKIVWRERFHPYSDIEFKLCSWLKSMLAVTEPIQQRSISNHRYWKKKTTYLQNICWYQTNFFYYLEILCYLKILTWQNKKCSLSAFILNVHSKWNHKFENSWLN